MPSAQPPIWASWLALKDAGSAIDATAPAATGPDARTPRSGPTDCTFALPITSQHAVGALRSIARVARPPTTAEADDLQL
jgi:hypothetical protein